LGRAADEYRDEFRARHPGTLAAYQSAGVYRLYWPRQRILEKAVERFTRRMLREWVLPPDEDLHDVLSEWVEQEWTRRELDAQALLTRLHEAAQEALEGSASTFFQRLLEPIAGSRAGVIPFSAFRGRKGDAEVA